MDTRQFSIIHGKETKENASLQWEEISLFMYAFVALFFGLHVSAVVVVQ